VPKSLGGLSLPVKFIGEAAAGFDILRVYLQGLVPLCERLLRFPAQAENDPKVVV